MGTVRAAEGREDQDGKGPDADTGRRLTEEGSLRRLSPMANLDRITIEPGKRSGKPCIRGWRMTVSDVLDYLASGMSEEDLLRDFPDLTCEDIRACLAFVADRERRLVGSADGEAAPRPAALTAALRLPSRHLDRCR